MAGHQTVMKLGDIIARQLTDPIRFILLNRRKS